jgi:hypothetical protein
MNRNILFAIIGALAVTSGLLGYHFYQESREPTGLQITVGKSGVSIDKKGPAKHHATGAVGSGCEATRSRQRRFMPCTPAP